MIKPMQLWLARNATGFCRRRAIVNLVILLAIVGIGAASRIWMVDTPNFKPVAALALLAGFHFRSVWPAVLAVLLMLGISDAWLGFYEPALALAVYGSLVFSGLLGVALHRSFEKRSKLSFSMAGRFGIASVGMSLAFFFLTNTAVWLSGSWYPTTADGLVHCYTAAIPFFRATLTSDLLFSQSLLIGYCLVVQLLSQRSFRTAQLSSLTAVH